MLPAVLPGAPAACCPGAVKVPVGVAAGLAAGPAAVLAGGVAVGPAAVLAGGVAVGRAGAVGAVSGTDGWAGGTVTSKR